VKRAFRNGKVACDPGFQAVFRGISMSVFFALLQLTLIQYSNILIACPGIVDLVDLIALRS
jgi:hypothetical protein